MIQARGDHCLDRGGDGGDGAAEKCLDCVCVLRDGILTYTYIF